MSGDHNDLNAPFNAPPGEERASLLPGSQQQAQHPGGSEGGRTNALGHLLSRSNSGTTVEERRERGQTASQAFPARRRR
jgi:hypothetical protein